MTPVFNTALLDDAIEKNRKRQEELRLGMIEKILTAIDKLSEEIAFKEAYLFGSVTKPFRFSERSDIDIGFIGLDNRHFFRAMSYLSEEAGLDVDIVQLEDCRLAGKIKAEGIRWRKEDHRLADRIKTDKIKREGIRWRRQD